MDFDEANHIYSDGGKRIPSVTQILNPTGAVKYYAPGSAERGTLAHEICAKYAQAMKDNLPVPFPYEPYADAFAMWCFKATPTWIKIESVIEAQIDGLRYAGRIDLLAEIEDRRVVIDLKTGRRADWHRAQIAAYALPEKAARGLVLYLHKDMSYVEEWIGGTGLAEGIVEFKAAIHEFYERITDGKTD